METVRLSSPSLEQQYIIECIGSSNVIVDAVAGSGKTTCNLHIAKKYSNLNILLVTYNKKLRLETKEKVEKLNITNLDVHTYHSFSVKNYNSECYTDHKLNTIIENNTKPRRKIDYDLIIVDEAQDMNKIYYQLIIKIYKDNSKKAKICVLGDMYQSIYSFNGADARYIKYADQIFNLNDLPWLKCPLSESFRITFEMSEFINKCMLNNDRIVSRKVTNIKPNYIICNVFGLKPFDEVKKYLNMGYESSDIFIIAPSVKNINTPIRELENLIKTELPHIMVYVPGSDEEKIDEEIIKNKVVFSTFHQVKGLERKVVLVYGFDSSYFDYYEKDSNKFACSNALYVATTRAIEHMTLFHHSSNDYLPFLNKENIRKYTNFESDRLSIRNITHISNSFNVSDLPNHLSADIIAEAMSYLDIKKIRGKNDTINIPIKTTQNDTQESVSEITGTAIPLYFEYKMTNKISVYDILYERNYNSIEVDLDDDFIDDGVFQSNNKPIVNEPNTKQYDLKKIDIKNLKPDELLYITNRWCSFKSGFLNKVCQIQHYDWLTLENLNKCVNRLTSLNLTDKAVFEKKSGSQGNNSTLCGKKINGYMDCVDGNNVYEFKCVKELDSKHYLQLATYMFLYESQNNIEINKLILDYEKQLVENENEIKNFENSKRYKIDMFYKNIERNNIKINEYFQDIEKFINNSNQKLLNVPNKTQKDIEKLQNKIKDNLDQIIKYTKKSATYKSMIPDLKKENIKHNEKIIKLQNNNIDEVTDRQIKLNNEKIDEFKKCYNSKIEMLKEENKKYSISVNNLQQQNDIEELNKLKNKSSELVQMITNLKTNKTNFKIMNNYYLYNILNDELYQIECSYERLSKMINFLIVSKFYNNNKGITDEIFISNACELQKKVINKMVQPNVMTQLNGTAKKRSNTRRIISPEI